MRKLWLAALILSVGPTVRLSAQARPWQSTDYYRLTVVSSPALSPDARRVAFVVTTVVEDKDRRHNEIWMAPADGSGGAGGGAGVPLHQPLDGSVEPELVARRFPARVLKQARRLG